MLVLSLLLKRNYINLQGFENITYKAHLGFEAVNDGDKFEVMVNNNTGSGWESVLIYDNFTGADILPELNSVSLSNKYDNPQNLSFLLIFNASLPSSYVFFSNVTLHADTTNTTPIQITRFDSKILGGDGSGDVYIYYNDHSQKIAS